MRTVLMYFKITLLFVMVGWRAPMAMAQQAIDHYIDSGLHSNVLLQQRNVSLQKAISALKVAKSMYLPSVNFLADYLTAEGGRSIPFPIGDMLNPVYSTLNQLTQTNVFPQIDNETINFLPRHFYDARIRTSLPVLNTDIGHSQRVHEQQVRLQEYEVDTYKRELVKAIKVAYFGYLNAKQAEEIYQSALELAIEGKRVNQKLLENGKGLPAYVLRSNSEVAQAEAQLTQANLQARNAQLYFNSLLNRSGNMEIDTVYDSGRALLEASSLLHDAGTIASREELQSLRTAIGIQETVLKMNRQYQVPKLNAFLDLGSQSEGFYFNNQTRYYMAGLQMEIPLFNGNRSKLKIQQSQLDVQHARLQLTQATEQLQLANSVAHHDLQSAWQTYRSSVEQLDAIQAYQRLISKGYEAGSNTYIETVDARNQYTMARMASLINKYQVLAAAAVLERENASYSFIK